MQKVSDFRYWTEDWGTEMRHRILIFPGMPRRVWRAKSFEAARKIVDSAGLGEWQCVVWVSQPRSVRPYVVRLLRSEWMRLTGVNDDEAFHAALRGDRLGWILDSAFEFLMKKEST